MITLFWTEKRHVVTIADLYRSELYGGVEITEVFLGRIMFSGDKNYSLMTQYVLTFFVWVGCDFMDL